MSASDKNTPVNGVVSINEDLECSVVREVKGQSWVFRRTTESRQYLANQQAGINTGAVESGWYRMTA